MSSESESVSPPLNIEKYSLVLVDVAGTTTSINFIKDTLFHFAVKQAETYLKDNWDEESVKESVKLIKEGDGDLDVSSAAARVKTLTEEGSSNEGLKTLQGLIYKQGYEKGDLKAHIFEDVPEAFEAWAKSRKVAVYSTGSVDSQKLLFSHSVLGDVSEHISKYFDLSVGLKTEAESYKRIAEEAEVKPEEIVFITDDFKEATAAKSGGLTAVLIKRDGNPEFPEEISKEFPIISSFKDFGVDKATKRKIDAGSSSEEAPPAKVPKTEETEVKPAEEEKPTEEKSEAMEVDPVVEKPEETKTATEETEQPVEKTETKKEETEEKMETATEEPKVEDAQPVVAEVESKETEKVEVAKEPDTKVEEASATTEEVVAKPVETQPETEEIKPATDEAKPATEKTISEPEEAKPVAEEKKVETEEAKPGTEEAKPVTEEKKPETEEAKPVEEEKPEKEESKPETEEVKPEEAKPEKPEGKQVVEEETVEAEEKPVENGEEKAEASTKIDEKENKSVLANGVENGKEESETENNGVETGEVKTDEVAKDDETEVKIKMLEESAESKTVSVEV